MKVTRCMKIITSKPPEVHSEPRGVHILWTIDTIDEIEWKFPHELRILRPWCMKCIVHIFKDLKSLISIKLKYIYMRRKHLSTAHSEARCPNRPWSHLILSSHYPHFTDVPCLSASDQVCPTQKYILKNYFR